MVVQFADERPAVAGRRLVLRTDASASVGTGHLMRMLALAQAWRDAGGNVTAIVGEAPAALLDTLADEGIRVEAAGSRSGPAAEPLAAALAEDADAVGAIDLAVVTAADLEPLQEGTSTRTLLVDDLARLEEYPVGLVLNQNAHADRSAYPRGGSADFLLGLHYVLLRREFRERPPGRRAVRSKASRLLVTFGGADPKA